MGETFPFFNSRQPPFFHSSIENAEQFENALESTLEKLKLAILKRRPNINSVLGKPLVRPVRLEEVRPFRRKILLKWPDENP